MNEKAGTQMQAAGSTFDAAYFENQYRHYAAQNPDRKLDFYLRVLGRHVPVDRPADVMDVGCGLGAWLGHLARNTAWRLRGSDVSEWAIAGNRRRLPEVELTVAGATEQPHPAASLDAITACDVLEHVPDRDAAAAAITTMVRPGGYVLIVVPVYDGLAGPIIRTLDKDPTHLHKHGRREWLAWFGRHFTLVEWWGILRYLLPGHVYLHVPTRLARAHTPAILMIGRR